MKNPRLLLIAGLCAAGFLCGFAAKNMARRLRASPEAAAGMQDKSRSSDAADLAAAADGSKGAKLDPKAAALHSSDTLETLAAADPGSLYGRLSLWMLDASEEDIAAYWTSVRDHKDRPNEITDLIFINWTRLDPRAAIAAVAGTGNEHYAWWAWACHDPQGSLAAAIAAGPDRVNNVAWGIGEFHADWLRAHFDEIPESARGNAISGMTKWDDTDDPLGLLKFLKDHNGGFNQRIFQALIRKDPWAAYDWIQKNGASVASQYGDKQSAMDALVKSMGETQPDALQRLADQTPAGQDKWKMEAVLFDNLLKTDPAAALEQAMSTKAPKIAADRLAAVGLNLVQTDPEKAYELAKRMFEIYPDALSGMTWVKYKNGSSGSGSASKESNGLVNELMQRDPGRVLQMASSVSPDANRGNSPFYTLSQKWAGQDLTGYADWVNQQTDPKLHDQGAGVVISQLTNQQRYDEALDWVMSLEKKENLPSVLYQWGQSNPAEAEAWLENSNLTQDQKDQYRQTLDSIREQQ